MTNDEILNLLYQNRDEERAHFQGKLCKTKYEIVGNTTPFLRDLAKQIKKSKDYEAFLNSDSNIYEYVILQGFLISYLNDLEAMKKFIYKIDDWSICDCTHLRKQFPEHLAMLYKWVGAKEEFVTRFAIISYMCVYLGKTDEKEDDKFIEEIYKINHHEYYVDMGIAWFIQKLYSINIEKAEKMLNSEYINEFTRKKAISKIKDSLRERKIRG